MNYTANSTASQPLPGMSFDGLPGVTNIIQFPGQNPEPDWNAAYDFFANVLRDDITVVTFLPDAPKGRGVAARWFGADAQAAAHFAAAKNREKRNVHYVVNRGPVGVHKKPKNEHITAARFAHVDIDPAGPEWDKAAAIADLEARANPSVIVDSGNGLQALWRLPEDSADIEAVRRANRGLICGLAGDCGTHDESRILRVPGTVNWPDARKRAIGRVPTLAKCVQPDNGQRFPLATIHEYFPVPQAKELSETPGAPVEWIDAPTRPEYTLNLSDVELIDKAKNAAGSVNAQFGGVASFRDLFDANADKLAKHFPAENSGDPFNRSAADAAIHAAYAFWTGGNPVRMDRLYRMSGLMRDKWAARPDYRIRTIGFALSNLTAVYDHSETATVEDITVDRSEDSIAAFFAAKRASNWRYAEGLGWLTFKDGRWQEVGNSVEFAIRATCAEVATALHSLTENQRNAIRSHRTISAVRRIAETDPALRVNAGDFDTDPMALNTPGGVVDLRTGIMRPATPSDMVMRCTSVTPSETANCPTWLAFWNATFGHDPALSDYMRRVMGYTLTARTDEEEVYNLHGVGGDGKGTLLKTMASAMGDYARVGTVEMWTNTGKGQHLTFMADLKGVRFHYLPEMPVDLTWNEQRLNQVSSGDVVTANRMSSDSFQFVPTAKLFFASNVPLAFRNVGAAIRRRVRVIEFNTVPDEKKDKRLKDKLQAELPGILRWLINACVDWNRDGLNTPAAVTNATAEYLDSEDAIGAFLSVATIEDVNAVVSNADMLRAYNAFATAEGYPVIHEMRSLGKRLRGRGMLAVRDKATRGWRGRKLVGTFAPGGTAYGHR
ncbi:phage/plasmid primase, P4 family [uncultured Nitratireductor sp.]|uniref:phage/plasmid primase, P4 family n=1 Tax=uncultured Nitratireductor sp. TaxID=520953 RepID=UPI0026365145|nr:phage/plasmid primase, P4 family [uncultured Nitratireductor sp.]